MPSGSSQILEYLRTLEKGTEFTAALLQERMGPYVSSGAVSGFLSKRVADGSMRVSGMEHGRKVYAIVDLSKVETRKLRGIGSKVGRSVSGTTSAQKVATLLRQMADQVEGFHSDIQSYSTADLLRELTRRERLSASEVKS